LKDCQRLTSAISFNIRADLEKFLEEDSMAKRSKPPKARPRKSPPSRFAHPFFTTAPPEQRPIAAKTGTRTMSAFAVAKLGPVPPPSRVPVMDLSEIIGQPGVDEIKAAGAIRFHAVGDTGRNGGDPTPQEQIAEAMTSDYDPAAQGRNPALLIHLGDVIYGQDKANLYRDEFYRPYMKYPGKIVAIPGNHDGEIFARTDPKSLQAFLDNFCAPTAAVPKIASDVRIFRETMTQPAVYWLLSAPFVNIIGLYSNIAEGPGSLLGTNNDNKQLQWLDKTLSKLKQTADNRALVIATHHPPFSSGGHSPSKQMLEQIDKVCAANKIVPHAMLAGHSHNYQRYTRTTDLGTGAVKIPYIVAGCGGHAESAVTSASGQQMGETVFEKSMQGYGYLTMTVDAQQLVIEMFETTGGVKRSFDKVTVDVANHNVG
jgi:calcineurin-like phosphoesterase family protein